MKHNIIFVILTAAILAVGFYAMDIAKLFGFDSIDESLIKAEKTGNEPIFLSQTNPQIEPMKLIKGEVYEPDFRSCSIASAMVKAMGTNSDLTSIAWGVRTDLLSSWKISENGYMFIENWEYINGRMNKRKLDCIINTADNSIVYIRFYNTETDQPSASDMNRGLERLGAASQDFYPKIAEIQQTIENKIRNIKKNGNTDELNLKYYNPEIFLTEQLVSPEDHALLLTEYIRQYKYLKLVAESSGVSKLGTFWTAPVSFSLTIFNEETDECAAGITPIFEAFSEETNQINPEYTAYGECIYQTIPLGDHSLTVIYNVFTNYLEGFYYN